MAEETTVQAVGPYEKHSQLILQGKRKDGRLLNEFRDIKLETDAISTANSSSLVKLGNTYLVCGCTTKLQKRVDIEQENEGINIQIELPPICSNSVGHRSQNTAQLLTKSLKNILEDTKCLNRESLSVDDVLCWSVGLELRCLNCDGCLLDAAVIATYAALKTLKLTDKTHHVLQKKFSLNKMPICSTFAMIGDSVICDPNLEEEQIAKSIFSVTVEPSDLGLNCHINKLGGKAINFGDLKDCIILARKRAEYIHEKLLKCTSQEDDTMECA